MRYFPHLTGLCLWLCALTPAHAQIFDEFGAVAPSPLRLIDLPTAGVLSKGTASMELRVFSGGGLLGGVYAGVSDRFMFGISFGGTNLIGTGDINWNPRPEVALKYLLIGENESRPGLAIGFESQGFGPYDDALERYEIKARGFYGVLSRNFFLAGTLGLHGGVNYSVENDDNDDNLNVFFGAEKSINPQFMVLAEYDLARNDNQNLPGFGGDRGYFNIGARVTLGSSVGIEFDLRNVFDNRVGAKAPSRELKIIYRETFSF